MVNISLEGYSFSKIPCQERGGWHCALPIFYSEQFSGIGQYLVDQPQGPGEVGTDDEEGSFDPGGLRSVGRRVVSSARAVGEVAMEVKRVDARASVEGNRCNTSQTKCYSHYFTYS